MTTHTCPEGHDSVADDYCDVCGSPMGAAAVSAAEPSSGSPAAAPSAGSPSPGAPSMLDLGGPASGAGTASGAGPAEQTCPHCAAPSPVDALFCERCGYDFTTGQLPRPLVPPGGAADAAADADAGTGAGDSGSAGGAAAGAGADAPRIQPPPSAPAAPAVPPSAQPVTEVEWVVEIWVDPDWHAVQDVDEACPTAGMPLVVPLRRRSLLVGRTSTSRNIHPDVDVASDTGVSRRHAQLTHDGQRWWIEDLQSANGTYVGPSGQPLPADPIAGRVELADDDRIYLGAWTRLVVRRATPSEKGPA